MPRFGQIVDRSKSGGRSVWEAWSELLESNEKAWVENRIADILTDPQLVEKMQSWFPSRDARLMGQPSRQRSAYNRSKKMVAAFRYLRDGEGFVCRATARGLPISEWRTPTPKRRKKAR